MSDTIRYDRETIRKYPFDVPTLWTCEEIYEEECRRDTKDYDSANGPDTGVEFG